MREHFIKIEIAKDGKVTFEVQGLKGDACLEATKFLEEALGGDVIRTPTVEYYEEPVSESETVNQG